MSTRPSTSPPGQGRLDRPRGSGLRRLPRLVGGALDQRRGLQVTRRPPPGALHGGRHPYTSRPGAPWPWRGVGAADDRSQAAGRWPRRASASLRQPRRVGGLRGHRTDERRNRSGGAPSRTAHTMTMPKATMKITLEIPVSEPSMSKTSHGLHALDVVVGGGVRAHALATLQGIENCDLVRIEREVEQGEVLDHARLADGSGDDDAAVLEVPAQRDLRNGLPVLRCDRVHFRCVYESSASNRAPCFDANPRAEAALLDVPLLEFGMKLNLVDCRDGGALGSDAVEMLRQEVRDSD